jgi:hypothetical protein
MLPHFRLMSASPPLLLHAHILVPRVQAVAALKWCHAPHGAWHSSRRHAHRVVHIHKVLVLVVPLSAHSRSIESLLSILLKLIALELI